MPREFDPFSEEILNRCGLPIELRDQVDAEAREMEADMPPEVKRVIQHMLDMMTETLGQKNKTMAERVSNIFVGSVLAGAHLHQCHPLEFIKMSALMFMMGNEALLIALGEMAEELEDEDGQ